MFRNRKSGKDTSSIEALEEAEETVRRVKARRDEVQNVVEALRTLREKNHFAEQLQHIMGGKNAGWL